MKLGQFITREIFFFKNYAENEAGETSSRPLFFKKKPGLRLKQMLSFNIFR